MAKPRKLDLFKRVLPALDRHDLDFYSTLDEDERKEFAGIVAMRCLSVADGPMGDWYVMAVNRANQRFFEMQHHPELQWKLLAMNGIGRATHNWVKGVGGTSSDRLTDFILRYWPMANNQEVEVILGQFTKESFNDFVDGTGAEPQDAKQIKKAYSER